MERYIDPRNATSELILVSVDTTEQNNGSSLLHGWISGSDSAAWNAATRWVCVVQENLNWDTYCSPSKIPEYAVDWRVIITEARNSTIDYCLVGEQGDNDVRCGFHYSSVVAILVCVCTLTESFLICWTALKQHSHTLVTVGDAIAEFLDRPEHETEASFLSTIEQGRDMQRTGMRKGAWKESNPGVRWFHAASLNLWVTSVIL